jgi:hypothetical protein
MPPDLLDAILCRFWHLKPEELDDAPDFGRLIRGRALYVKWDSGAAPTPSGESAED